MDSIDFFVKFLQACITPVALISGVGLILLTITNRLGRTTDRTRQLVNELDNPEVKRRIEKENEVRILYRRCRYLWLSIASITFSVLSSSLMIPLLASMIIFNLELKVVGFVLFILSIAAILVSAVYFFLDVMLSLRALFIEAKEYLD